MNKLKAGVSLTTNGNIDLNHIVTYGELKKALPATGDRRVPGVKQLRGKAECLLIKEAGSGTIEIFDNGFFIFEECGCQTVYGVDRCERRETYNNNGNSCVMGEVTDFAPYPWVMILEAAGAARLSHNSESRQDYQSEISLDDPASENNINFSVKPEAEIREEEDATRAWHKRKMALMRMAVSKLSDKQRTIMMMDRVEKLTQEQIAERMGISRRTVREHLEAIEKKLKKYIPNTRHFDPRNLD